MTYHQEARRRPVEALEERQGTRSEPAASRQDNESEPIEGRTNVSESEPADLYRSHDVSRANTGRWRSVTAEAERFWSKVDRTETEGCWLWLGRLNEWGYGHFQRTLTPGVHRTEKAHRFAFALLVGPIPDGLTIDHLCGRPACVRPDHLEAVTNAENLRRRHARRRTEGPVR